MINNAIYQQPVKAQTMQFYSQQEKQRGVDTSNKFQTIQPLLKQAILSLIIQLLQHLLASLHQEKVDTPPEEPKELDLSEDELKQLTDAKNLGAAFGGGNVPSITNVVDTNNDGILSPGDTAETVVRLPVGGGNQFETDTFTVTQDLLDISDRLQSQVPSVPLSLDEIRSLPITPNQFQDSFDNDGNGILSLGDEIVTGGELQVVDSAFLERLNQGSSTSFPGAQGVIQPNQMVQQFLNENYAEGAELLDVDGDNLISAGDRIAYSDPNRPGFQQVLIIDQALAERLNAL